MLRNCHRTVCMTCFVEWWTRCLKQGRGAHCRRTPHYDLASGTDPPTSTGAMCMILLARTTSSLDRT